MESNRLTPPPRPPAAWLWARPDQAWICVSETKSNRREAARRLEAGQRVPPGALRVRLVVRGEPGEVVPERTPGRQGRSGVSPGERSVAGEHIGEHLEDAPPVEQHVVEAPHHLHLGVR